MDLWSLKLLNKSLEKRLLIFKGDPLKILKDLKNNNNVSGVYWNRNYAPWEIKRDTVIKQEIKKLALSVKHLIKSSLGTMGNFKKGRNSTKFSLPFIEKDA